MKGKMRFYYDEEADYLEIFAGEPRENYGEDVSKGVTLFKDEKTGEIIGIGVFNFRAKARDLKDIMVDLPFEVNFSMVG
jgi:uncharacterized protein YuzE